MQHQYVLNLPSMSLSVKLMAYNTKIQQFENILKCFSLKSLQYEGRLQKLGLCTLDERRNRADLTEVFKMAHGFSAIPLTDMFQIDTAGRTRGHSLKLVKSRSKKNIRKNFFSHRVVSKWNMLDNDSVTAKTVNGFKTKLERERAKKMGLFLD